MINEMEQAIATVYRGPLEVFVSRRDALARQLRAEGKRADADLVKGLRKPTRTAWALNSAVFDEPAAVERVASAVSDALEAQSGGGDLRGALDLVRAAVRSFADSAAQVATRAGHPLEPAVLVPAVLAVIGEAGTFAALRSGQLTEVPDGGGLDFLSAAPPGTAAATIAGVAPELAESAASPPTLDAAPAATAGAELQRAQLLLAEARERSLAAEKSLEDNKTQLAAAEQQLSRAQEELAARLIEVERAQQRANTCAAELREAEKAVADARARIARLTV